ASPDADFWATYLGGKSAQVLQANEMLAILDGLRPLYEKQPPHAHAQKNWLQMRMNYLRPAGLADEAQQLRKKLAADSPRDYSLQRQYAHSLAEGGDYPAAYAWLTRILV